MILRLWRCLADSPIWLVARKDLPPKDLTDLIRLVETQSGEGAGGKAVGVGGPSDLNETYFENVTDTKFQLVPYLGGAPLNQDLLGGRLDFTLGMAASTYPFVRSGQLKAYAVMAKSRWWAAPDVPTMEEAGVPGLWQLVLASALGAKGDSTRCRCTTEFRGAVGLGRRCRPEALC